MTLEELKNQIICGDCLEVMKGLPDECIDLTVTSPPYDNLRTYNWYTFDFEWIAKELYRITKDWGVVVWVVWDATVNGSETGTSFKQALYFKEIWFNLHDTMIWYKDTFSAVWALVNRYAPVFEYMFVLSKWKLKTFNPLKDRKNKEWWRIQHGAIRGKDWIYKKNKGWNITNEYGQRFNVWEINIIKTTWHKHPASFPEKLAEGHILSWSNEWDIIFDPFMWSWTTAKMAKMNNRNFIGAEISQEYVDIANERLKHTTVSLF